MDVAILGTRWSTRPEGSITQLLIAWSDGRREALEDLVPLVYDPRRARIVGLRYVGGLTIEETAEVVREWSIAKAWLRADLSDRA